MRRFWIAVFLIAGVFSMPGLQEAAKGQDRMEVLIIFNISEGKDLTYVQKLVNSVMMEGVSCSSASAAEYTEGLMYSYNGLILINRSSTDMNALVMRELQTYEGRVLWMGDGLQQLAKMIPEYGIRYTGETFDANEIQFDFGYGAEIIRLTEPARINAYDIEDAHVFGTFLKEGVGDLPYSFSKGKLYYIDITENSYKTEIAQKVVLHEFLGLEKKAAGLYIKLDYIYPVSDLGATAAMAEYLHDQSIPFVFVAMPFYTNTDTEEARNYGRLLRYLSSCGGSPVLHCPVFSQLFSGDVPRPDEVAQNLDIALKNMAAMEVYPLAIEMPEAYLSMNDFKGIFQRFSDYFAVEGDGKDVYTVSADTAFPLLGNEVVKHNVLNNAVAEVRLPIRMQDKKGNKEEFEEQEFFEKVEFLSNNRYVNYAVSLPSLLDIDQFKKIVDGLKSRNIQFLDFNFGNHEVNIGEEHIKSSFGALTYNGKLQVQTQTPRENTAGSSKKSLAKEVTGILKRGNMLIALFSAVTMVILVIALFTARSRDRLKFIRRR